MFLIHNKFNNLKLSIENDGWTWQKRISSKKLRTGHLKKSSRRELLYIQLRNAGIDIK